jgi:hypothetical protein
VNQRAPSIVEVTMDVAVVESRASAALARVLCALVALAAGIVGVLMLAAPGSTDEYFSWSLAPPALAALVGGFYVASAAVFGWAAVREPWSGLRGLCVAVFGLTLPTLVATIRHHDVFDFGRWQAVGWVILFVASPLLFGLALVIAPREVRAGGPSLPARARLLMAGTAVVYSVVAVALWTMPDAVSSHGPFAAGAMGVRFAGSWAAFLAILAGYAAVRPRWAEARVPVLALVAWPIAGLVAAAVRYDDHRSGMPSVLYLAGLAMLAATAVSVLGAAAAHQPRGARAASPGLHSA